VFGEGFGYFEEDGVFELRDIFLEHGFEKSGEDEGIIYLIGIIAATGGNDEDNELNLFGKQSECHADRMRSANNF
jgi:hypothetical protein